MAHFFLAALMQVSALGAGSTDIEQACRQSQTTGRPLVVLIGAVWCPACEKMKNSILPQVAEADGLDRVIFTYLDYDRHQQLASRLSQGGSIPQLIRFDPTPAGWKRKYLIGAKSPGEVYDFINAGLLEEEKAEMPLKPDQQVKDRSKSDFVAVEGYGPIAADRAGRLTPDDARAPEKSGPSPSNTSARPDDAHDPNLRESVRPIPAAANAGTNDAADETQGQPWIATPSRVERPSVFSRWRAFFQKRPSEYRNWHNSAVYYYPHQGNDGTVYYYPYQRSNRSHPHPTSSR
ncbi:MAG: thioredoxin family protein [Pirellulales bacterium]|nr:thioredoxin family protein [Pirellulales bacterium]